VLIKCFVFAASFQIFIPALRDKLLEIIIPDNVIIIGDEEVARRKVFLAWLNILELFLSEAVRDVVNITRFKLVGFIIISNTNELETTITTKKDRLDGFFSIRLFVKEEIAFL
jgi:hypothetical protein